MLSENQLFKKGIIDVSPSLMGVFPFGIIYGALGVEFGLSALETFMMSIIIFAGSSQLVFMQLFSLNANPYVILGSVGAVNARHFLYGAVISEHVNHLSKPWKITLSYLLTDQAFMFSNKYFIENKKVNNIHYHLLGTGFMLWFMWQISTLLGIILGSFIPEELGLNFAIPLTFLALIINDLKKPTYLLVTLVSGVVSILTFNFPLKAYILISASSGILIAYLYSFRDENVKKSI